MQSAALHSLEVTECVFVLASNGTPCHSNAADDQLLWTTNMDNQHIQAWSSLSVLLLPLSVWFGSYATTHILWRQTDRRKRHQNCACVLVGFPAVKSSQRKTWRHTQAHTLIQMNFWKVARMQKLMTHRTPTHLCHNSELPTRERCRPLSWLHHQSQWSQYSQCSRKHTLL